MEDKYTYAVCNVVTDIPNFDFTQTLPSNSQLIRKSLDGILFVVKWIITPTFIADGTVVPSQTLNHEDALTLMETSEWTPPLP